MRRSLRCTLIASFIAALAIPAAAWADVPWPKTVAEGCTTCSTATVRVAEEGGFHVGNTLSCDPGDWTGTEPIRFFTTWQVRRDGSTSWQPVSDAETLKLTARHEHRFVRCMVMGLNADGIGLAIARSRWIVANETDETEPTGDAPDEPTYGTPPNPPRGSKGADSLGGTAQEDLLDGGLGNDTLRGLGGSDLLRGGFGRDRILGGPGNDLIRGGAGNDYIVPGAGADTVFGDAGDDHVVVSGDATADTVSCGPGQDLVIAGPTDVVDRSCERVVRRKR